MNSLESLECWAYTCRRHCCNLFRAGPDLEISYELTCCCETRIFRRVDIFNRFFGTSFSLTRTSAYLGRISIGNRVRMKSSGKILLLLSVLVCTIAGRPDREGKANQLSLKWVLLSRILPSDPGSARAIASHANLSKQFLTTIRRQWSCVNGSCEETVTKCTNNVCDSTNNRFKAESYQPEVPPIVTPPLDFQSIGETFKFPPIPSINLETPFDNSGLIELVTNNENFSYFWSNSKHVSRKCENKICSVTTKTCSNGKCEEKTEQTSL